MQNRDFTTFLLDHCLNRLFVSVILVFGLVSSYSHTVHKQMDGKATPLLWEERWLFVDNGASWLCRELSYCLQCKKGHTPDVIH